MNRFVVTTGYLGRIVMKQIVLSVTLLIVTLEIPCHVAADGIPLCISVRSRIPDDDWRHIASRYSLMMTFFSPTARGQDLSSENERARWIKSLNPKLTLLVYGSAINAANVRLQASGEPTEHRGWFLRSDTDEWLTDHEFRRALHLDPGNTEWQRFIAKAYQDYITRYGYDGGFVDLVTPTTHYVNFKKNGKAVNPRTDKVYTDADWKAANLELLLAIRSAIGDKLMIINGAGEARSYFTDGYSDFLAVADGAALEGFLGWWQKPPWKGVEAAWKADVDAPVDCVKRGKIGLATANVLKRAKGEPAEAYDELYRFITASFLLGIGKGHCFAYYAKVPGRPEDYRPGEEVLPACGNVSLGEPRGAYEKNDGVYQRDFQRGKAFVNPTGRAGRVHLVGKWKTAEGQAVISPLTLPARAATILLREATLERK